MRLALHAEWTKIRTVASPRWLLLGTIAVTVALNPYPGLARTEKRPGTGRTGTAP